MSFSLGRAMAARHYGNSRRNPAVRLSATLTAVLDLLEYQGKELFARHGVPVPRGKHAKTIEEAVAAADEIGYPCVVKAQVQIGGRGKAGGDKGARRRAGGGKNPPPAPW